ncbi:MAG TPA: response regulator transcription factor [Fimbriimonas sp.]
MVRVAIVDDHRIVIAGLRRLLDMEPGIQVVGTAVSAMSGIELCDETRPDVLILDMRLPDGRGTQVISRFRERYPGMRIVALTGYGGMVQKEALEAGANVFLTKELASDEVVRAVLGPAVRTSVSTGWDELSDREKEVARLAITGMSNPEIARELMISINTVKTHLASVLYKLGARNRTELATVMREV